jgi:predicted small metal-binding protein
MKEFTCRKLGNNCNAVLIAQSEEKLTELVSIHLRDVHGVTDIPQEKIAQIKNLFATHASQDAAAVVDRIFEKYNCSGEPECTWRYIIAAETILTGGTPGVHAEAVGVEKVA